MPSQASPYRDLVESRVYLHYLRTGHWADTETMIEEVERKFNPYHDDVGRFTSPPGVTVSYGNTRPPSTSHGSNTPGRQRRRPQAGRILTGDKRPNPNPVTSTGAFRSNFVRNAVSTNTSNADTYFELNKRQKQLDNLRNEAGQNPDPLIFADFEDFQSRLNANRKLLDERAKIADRHVFELLRAGMAPVDIGAGAVNIARGEAELRDYIAVAGAIPVTWAIGKVGKFVKPVPPAASVKVTQLGGPHSAVRKLRGHHSHHIPADSSSPLARGDGPSVAMLPDHHRKTASYGRGAKPDAYRKQQAELISKGDFQGAMQMDIKDIRNKFGNLYDDAIEQAVTYSRTKGQ